MTVIDLWLESHGEPVTLPEQRLRRTRQACFILGEEAGEQLRMTLLSYVPAKGGQILRLIRVENLGGTALEELRLHSRSKGDSALALQLDGSPWRQHLVNGPGFQLQAGEHRDFILSIEVGVLGESQPPPKNLPALERSAEHCRRWWQRRLLASTIYDCDRAILRDLLQDRKLDLIALGTERAGMLGGDTGNKGPEGAAGLLLLYLRFGLWTEAAAVLPMDSQDSLASAWSILLHYWYWRASRDGALIRSRWHEIESCLSRMAESTESADLGQASLRFLATAAAASLVESSGIGSGAERGRVLRRESWRLAQTAEARFWLEREGRYAGSLSETLLPLWAGWTWSQGDRKRLHVRNSIREHWRPGLIPSPGEKSDTEVDGLSALVLVALNEVRAAEVSPYLTALLQRPELLDLSDPQSTGMLLDAILFSLTGLRGAAVPGHAENDIRLAPRLPPGCEYLTVKGAAQRGLRFDLHLREEDASTTSFDLVLIETAGDPVERFPVALRLHGDTHLAWLEDRPGFLDADHALRSPRKMSGSSHRQVQAESFLPDDYFR
jgi:hypothetical protein